MNKTNLVTAIKILTNAGLPLSLSPAEKLHKYVGCVLKVNHVFGTAYVAGDVVTHLAFGDYCRLNKAEIISPPITYCNASPGETTNLA